jgi:hypothetical protein
MASRLLQVWSDSQRLGDPAMRNEGPVAFAAIVGSLVFFVSILLHSVVGFYRATDPLVDAAS